MTRPDPRAEARALLASYDAASAHVRRLYDEAEDNPDLYRRADERQTDVWQEYADSIAETLRALLDPTTTKETR